MRNATLSVLWVLLLGASTAAAQTDDTVESGEDVEEAPPESGAADAAEPDAAPVVADPAAPAADSAPATPADPATPAEPAVGEAPAAGEAPVDAPAAEAAEPAPVDESATDELAAPDAELEETAEEPAAEAEAETEEEEEEAAEPPALPWRNSFFSWTHQATFNSFIRDAQPTYNPYYQQSFGLSPRWYLAPSTYFLLSQSLGIEVTDADGTALNRDPQLSDTVVEFRQMIPWEGFMFMGQVRVTLPLSKASQAAQRYLQPGLGLQIIRVIPEINLTLAASFAYRTWLAGSNVVQTGAPQVDHCPAAATTVNVTGTGEPTIADTSCDQLGTLSAARDTMTAGLTAILTFGNFNIAAQYLFFNLYGYELAPAYIHVATSEQPIRIADGSPSHWRNFNYFTIAVGYQVASWLNLSLGIQNSPTVGSAYNPDGSIRNPIFTPDTSVYLSASVQLDTIYSELAGTADDGLTPEERQRRRQGLAARPTGGVAF